ncbi:MAG: hypothetical protein LAO77_14975 [Acidobacteriia bacterium]|nr:hypothetical protein [Terriglobia bacterium]
MIFRLALRSLATRPIRTAVLACGFGFGIAIMAALLGVGQVILEQAHSPALAGGGEVVIGGRFGSLDSARFVMSSVLGSPDIARRATAVSPSKSAPLYLIKDDVTIAVSVRAGIPSLQKAIGDPEVAGAAEWIDTGADRAWAHPAPGDTLRLMDRFHPIPNAPEFSSSWAEWLYFNGRTPDGRLRFYLTFLAGPASPAPGRRVAGVRLQLERDGQTTSYSLGGDVDEATLLASAPDFEIAGNRVTLTGLRYQIDLALPGASGQLTLDASPGQSLPPATIRGARGWLTGYTAPVLSGVVNGALTIGRDRIAFDRATGYHDHNWGFWEGVRWQWGQVAHDDLSIVYGRVFPPADVADPDRMPGFLGVLSAKGPLGFSTNVTIRETSDGASAPTGLFVHARSQSTDVTLSFTAERSVRTRMGMTAPARPAGPALDFLQLGGEYRVTGHVGDRKLDFAARGAAETFRPR